MQPRVIALHDENENENEKTCMPYIEQITRQFE